MAVGWAQDGAVQDQIDATVAARIEAVKNRLPEGASLTHCIACRAEIPEERRQAIPGVRHCIHCQAKLDLSNKSGTLAHSRV